jgi:hypothetical protein
MARWDAERATIVLTDQEDEKREVQLTMVNDGERARFSGTIDGHRVDVRAERHGAFPLETRGFHWVQEKPFNR